MNDKVLHIPVLLDEVINALSLTKNEVYVDATFGFVKVFQDGTANDLDPLLRR